MKWLIKYIGLEFEDKGRGPKYDCWGLLHKVLKEKFNINVPSYDDQYFTSLGKDVSKLFQEESKKWEQILLGKEQLGDVIILNSRNNPIHCGLIIDQKKMLHIEEKTNSCIERYDAPNWRNRIYGIFRYKS